MIEDRLALVGLSFMRVVRACLVLVALLVLARAAGYLVYVYEQLPTPREVGDLESKLVHLAWRVQAGVRIYPPWRDYPHVTNFFSPGYFLVVGLIGSITGAGLQGLFVIGRGVTVACALATAIVLGLVIRRCDGPGAGMIGAIASLGAAPMIGAALMVRPDTMAELLGITGFFLALGRGSRSRLAGVVILVAAILTKQTAAIFLIAASVALAVSGRPRQAATMLGAGVMAVGVVVAAVSFFEPMFAASLLGEGNTPWDFANWASQLLELGAAAPDLLVVPVLGLWIWVSDRPRRTTPVILWLAIFGTGLLTAAKLGSGLNYFLGLRVVEAMAIGAIWGASRISRSRSPGGLAAVLLVTALSLVPGTILSVRNAWLSRLDARFYSTTEGKRFLVAQRQFFRLAEDPQVKLLTDSGLLQLHQKERAPFVDPFQFRHMVNSGQIQPDLIQEKLRTESYDLVIATADLYRPEYDASTSGFPEVVARAARAHYVPASRQLGLFIYVPRNARRPSPAKGAGAVEDARPDPFVPNHHRLVGLPFQIRPMRTGLPSKTAWSLVNAQ